MWDKVLQCRRLKKLRRKVDVKRRSKTGQYVCLAPTRSEFVVKVCEDGERKRREGKRRELRGV